MAGLSDILSHFSQLFSCCYIITGQETGHGVTIQLINQMIDCHLSHEEDCSMCCQPRIDIHSNPLAVSGTSVGRRVFPFPSEQRGRKQLDVARNFISNSICLINLPLRWRSGAVEAIIQHLWQLCGIDQEEMNCGDSLTRACANLNPSRFSDEHSSIYFWKIFNLSLEFGGLRILNLCFSVSILHYLAKCKKKTTTTTTKSLKLAASKSLLAASWHI